MPKPAARPPAVERETSASQQRYESTERLTDSISASMIPCCTRSTSSRSDFIVPSRIANFLPPPFSAFAARTVKIARRNVFFASKPALIPGSRSEPAACDGGARALRRKGCCSASLAVIRVAVEIVKQREMKSRAVDRHSSAFRPQPQSTQRTRRRDGDPVLGGFKGEISGTDSLNFLDGIVTIERSVACDAEVSELAPRAEECNVPQSRKYVMTPIAQTSTCLRRQRDRSAQQK